MFTRIKNTLHDLYFGNPKYRITIQVVIVCIAAIINFIAFSWFLLPIKFRNSGLITPGLGGFVLIILNSFFSNTASEQAKILFYVLQFVFNIPLIIFGLFKLGLRFSIYSGIFLFIQMMLSICFGHTEFGNHVVISGGGESEKIINALIGAIFAGAACSLVYRVGGSSAGFDFIAFYFSKVKGKAIAFAIAIINFTVVFASIIWIDVILHHSSFLSLFNLRLLSTVFFIAVFSITISFMYPKDMWINVEVITTHLQEITTTLDKKKFSHSYNEIKNPVHGGEIFSNKNLIITRMTYFEFAHFCEICKGIDKECMITAIPIKHFIHRN